MIFFAQTLTQRQLRPISNTQAALELRGGNTECFNSVIYGQSQTGVDDRKTNAHNS